jgi:hypothetical protein
MSMGKPLHSYLKFHNNQIQSKLMLYLDITSLMLSDIYLRYMELIYKFHKSNISNSLRSKVDHLSTCSYRLKLYISYLSMLNPLN